ncbi:MAG: hypothetical protein KJ044_14195, partial [Planctomycetes bacterium]|nr:hypothetical protein [Planctomycetota bacterium]
MLARITPALAALTLLAPLALAQKRPDAKALDSRTDAILRFMDADNDGRIAWQEAWNKHNEHRSAVRSAERAEALGDDEKDFPGLTRAKVAAAYANLLEPLDALLADSNRNLSVDRGELRAFLARNAVGEAGKPQRWHYEQLCAAHVRRDWELWLRRLDRDNDGRFSRTEMDDHYLVDVSDKVFRAADADKDNHLTQAEFITLHVEHRLAGVTVEVSDAEDSVGVNGDAQSSAGEKPADGAEPEKQPAPDDAGNPRKTEATRPVARGDMRFKVGSSWVIRRQSSFAAGEVVRWGVGNSATG